ncbi:hypothetical protein [Halomicrococcus sp. NG-SE-24]|uniref:hypothetical protein n=1 Tax=Halomicrococcus sp. NG-SE-24 TaxID=3436928 RepID=UPI003D997F14
MDEVRIAVGEHVPIIGAIDIQPLSEDVRGFVLNLDRIGKRTNGVCKLDTKGI